MKMRQKVILVGLFAVAATEARNRKYLSKRNDDGTTALVAVLHKRGGQLWVANAGDSRAVLVRADGTHDQLSVDHKPVRT